MGRQMFWRIAAGAFLAAGVVVLGATYASGWIPSRMTGHSPASLWLGLNFLTISAFAPATFACHAFARLSGREASRPLAGPSALACLAVCFSALAALWVDVPDAAALFSPRVIESPASPLFPVPWCFFAAVALVILEIRAAAQPGSPRARAYCTAAGLISAAGFLLSVALQCSLGGMFRVAGTRIHPLWHSPHQPLLFFLSAAAGGCALIVFLNEMWRRSGAEGMDFEILRSLSQIMGLAVALFSGTRLWEIAHSGLLAGSTGVFGANNEAGHLFWLETGLSLLAVVIVLHPARRNHAESLFSAAVMTLGVLMAHRLNVSVGIDFLPSPGEAAVSAALIAAGAVAFAAPLRHAARAAA